MGLKQNHDQNVQNNDIKVFIDVVTFVCNFILFYFMKNARRNSDNGPIKREKSMYINNLQEKKGLGELCSRQHFVQKENNPGGADGIMW